MITGAEMMVKCLEEEKVEMAFGYPGAAICPFYDFLYLSDIHHVLVRQEQNAAHLASGYARSSSKTGVCIATSGPGATNLITGVATAYMDSIPMVAITGQVDSVFLGTDMFQEADVTGACESFTKHSYLVKNVADIPRIFKEAFHIAKTGRPGPVLIDIPVDVQKQTVEEFIYPEKVDIIGYKPRTQGHSLQIKKALEAISGAKRPVICCGGGVVLAGARRELIDFAEKTNIPVVSTMMGLGVMPGEHPLHLGMLGMFGPAKVNRAINAADLIILCGSRVADRAIPAPEEVIKHANIIHIDIDPAEIGKNMTAHIPIVGDIRLILSNLLEKVKYEVPKEWTDTIGKYRDDDKERGEARKDFVEPRSFLRSLSRMMKSKSILVSDVGQHQIWASNNFLAKEGRFLTSGGLGTMGYALPAALGAKIAKPKRQVVCVCGDGAFQMTLCELSTLVQENIDIKIILMRNGYLGMVREVQDKLYEGRYMATVLDGDPDFLKLAEAYGIEAAVASSNEEAEKLSEKMFQSNKAFMLICNVDPQTPSM